MITFLDQAMKGPYALIKAYRFLFKSLHTAVGSRPAACKAFIDAALSLLPASSFLFLGHSPSPL